MLKRPHLCCIDIKYISNTNHNPHARFFCTSPLPVLTDTAETTVDDVPPTHSKKYSRIFPNPLLLGYQEELFLEFCGSSAAVAVKKLSRRYLLLRVQIITASASYLYYDLAFSGRYCQRHCRRCSVNSKQYSCNFPDIPRLLRLWCAAAENMRWVISSWVWIIPPHPQLSILRLCLDR